MRVLSVLGLVALSVSLDAQPALDTTHVVLVTLDGLRWQEVFTGAEGALIDHEEFVSEPEDLRERFWSEDPMLRREKLLPSSGRSSHRRPALRQSSGRQQGQRDQRVLVLLSRLQRDVDESGRRPHRQFLGVSYTSDEEVGAVIGEAIGR